MDLTPKNGRGKTMKRRTDPLTSVNEMDPALVSFLTTESATALKRPWLRLERGVRMQKFRAFAEASAEMATPAEKDILYRALVSANDAKLLNSKQQVIYDSEKGEILDIKGLRISRIGEAPPTVKIEATRPTKKGSKSVEEA
jgi:hypothetical protein